MPIVLFMIVLAYCGLLAKKISRGRLVYHRVELLCYALLAAAYIIELALMLWLPL